MPPGSGHSLREHFAISVESDVYRVGKQSVFAVSPADIVVGKVEPGKKSVHSGEKEVRSKCPEQDKCSDNAGFTEGTSDSVFIE